MTTSAQLSKQSAAWMGLGFMLGSAVGSLLHDVSFGVALGLTAGSTVATTLEWRSGGLNGIWPYVGAATVSCMVAVRLILRY